MVTFANGKQGFVVFTAGNSCINPNPTETDKQRAVEIHIVQEISYSISGTVTTSDGSPLSGVTMTLSGDGTGTTITSSRGIYVFTGLANGSYTVTPSKTEYTFSPTSRSVIINNADVIGQNFTGTYIGGGTTYSISGTVATSGGNPLAGVTMTLSGGASATTTTNSEGNYSFTGLSNGSYTVTPGKIWCHFTPISRNVTVDGADVTGQDFTGRCR